MVTCTGLADSAMAGDVVVSGFFMQIPSSDPDFDTESPRSRG
jgi:hypothetical protein